MFLSPIHVSILQALANFYWLTRAQLQQVCTPPGTDPTGRRMRKHLTNLLHAGLINQTNGEVVFPNRNGAPAPVYYSSRKGIEYLSVELQRDCAGACTLTPNWQHLHHWCRVSQFHILVDQAVAKQREVQCEGWLNEWDVANPEEKDPAKRYKLFCEIQEDRRIVCAPDAATLMSYCGYKKIFLLEIDRGTSGIQQIANSKTPGVAALAANALHGRYFPDTNVNTFSVLLVTTTENRRKALQKAISTKPGADLWRFVSWNDLDGEILFRPILYTCDGGPIPWFKRPEEGTQP